MTSTPATATRRTPQVAGVFADATSTGNIGILTRGSSQITSERDGIFARANAGSVAIEANGQIGGFDTSTLTFETVGNNGINAIVVGGGATGADVYVENNGLVAADNIGINAFNNAAGAVDNTPDIERPQLRRRLRRRDRRSRHLHQWRRVRRQCRHPARRRLGQRLRGGVQHRLGRRARK